MKPIYLTFLLFIIFSCSSTKKVIKTEKCSKFYKNNYSKILNEKYETISNNDTIKFNEIKFKCVYSSLYTHKVMFDKFGKWNKAIYPSNKKRPILMWRKIDLYSNGKKYNVYTNGIEEWKDIYASVMVFDENETDLLSNESSEKENLTKYFADLIKKNKTKDKDFYKIYWQMINPKHHKDMKINKN